MYISYRQKAHQSSFPTMHLPNGNVAKFSHMNRKHFTVGDAMAFPMENINPQNVPFPLHDVDPHLMQQCLNPPHTPPQTAAPTVEALSHTYAVKSQLDTMAPPKSTPSRGPTCKPYYLPYPWTQPTYGVKWSAICPQCTGQTDQPTDRQIVHGESLTTIGRCAPRETRPKKSLDGAAKTNTSNKLKIETNMQQNASSRNKFRSTNEWHSA